MPPELKQWRETTPEERRRRALRVLQAGRVLYRAGGLTLEEALSDGSLESWWAKEIVREYVRTRNLTDWERSERQPRSSVYRVLDACIRRCRAKRGGWFVSPRLTEAV
jgi:hypothetical protein